MSKISPFLWFDNNAEEAMKFYTSVFKNSKIINVSRFDSAISGQDGQLMSATLELEGQIIMLMNGGPEFKFNEAISFFVSCKNQEEVDYYWSKLTDGGQESQCGWLKDRFGLSWQIVPTVLGDLLSNPDKEKAARAMQAMLKMKKLDIEKLKNA